MASVLYEKVLYHLDLVETDYFGLQYSDTSNVSVSYSHFTSTSSTPHSNALVPASVSCSESTWSMIGGPVLSVCMHTIWCPEVSINPLTLTVAIWVQL